MFAAKDDDDFSVVLMEDETFEILEKIGYVGVPSKEKLSNRERERA